MSYLVGDLLILPKTHNAVATAADAVMVFAAAWIAAEAADCTLSFGDMLILAVAAGLSSSSTCGCFSITIRS